MHKYNSSMENIVFLLSRKINDKVYYLIEFEQKNKK
jgi:hypothetical protein